MNAHTKRTGHLAALLSLMIVGGGGIVSVTEALAVNNVSSCGAAIDTAHGSATLTADISYTGGAACLQVADGKDLNLNGHTITCTAGYTCGQAVLCTTASNANSTIQSTNGSDTINDISGRFTAAVKNCGTVKNLKIVDATTGILFDDATYDGKDFLGNVIESHAGGTGIDVKIKDNADSISDNRITGGDIGIRLAEGKSSSTGGLVRDNIIRGFAVAGISSSITSNDYFRLDTNSIIEGGSGSIPFDIAGTHETYSGNICEDEGPIDNNRCACELDRTDLTTVGACP